MAYEEATRLTANDRFKRRSSASWPIGLILAVAVHFGVFQAFPELQATAPPVAAAELEAVELPPPVKVPPPPERIARPATPRIAAVEVNEEITIAPTTFEDNPVEALGPPPAPKAAPNDHPRFIPYTVAPKLKNPEEVVAALQREYPEALRRAKLSGSVQLWIYVSEAGRVLQTQLAESSGHPALDEAARRVAEQMIFTPAMNRDQVTPVWVTQPIEFSVS